MSFSARVVPLLLLALLGVAIPVRAQAPAKATPKVPKGTVSGRVTIKDKPAPGVPVGLRKVISGGMAEPFLKGITDQNGVYRITNVAPGTYDVMPSAPAFVVADSGNQRAKNVVMGEGEDVEGIDFTLVRGGVITGKVTDADGHPIIQQQVNLYTVEAFSTQQPIRQVYASLNTQTDDRGVYRFFGLTTGRYKVAAGRADDVYAGTNMAARVIYKQVFHPDAVEHEKAKIIDVSEGSAANDVDIKLGRALQTFSASGRVVNSETGLPITNVRFSLQRTVGQRFELVPSYGVSNNLGDFVIDGLAPGNYSVFLYPDPSSVMRVEPMTFEIVDQDVSGITVKLSKGSTVSGVIVFEHENKQAWAQLLELRLRGYVTPNTGIGVSVQPTPISADGTFVLSGLSPGNLNLFLSTPTGFNAPKGFLITRIEHEGVVRQPSILEIKEGEHLFNVRVFVSYGAATLRGVVNVDAGLMPQGARLFARLTKPGMQVPIGAVPVDARGHFLMEAIPAGVYEVMVFLSGRPTSGRAPSIKQEVTLQDNTVTEVSLTLDLSEQIKP